MRASQACDSSTALYANARLEMRAQSYKQKKAQTQEIPLAVGLKLSEMLGCEQNAVSVATLCADINLRSNFTAQKNARPSLLFRDRWPHLATV